MRESQPRKFARTTRAINARRKKYKRDALSKASLKHCSYNTTQHSFNYLPTQYPSIPPCCMTASATSASVMVSCSCTANHALPGTSQYI